MVTHMAACLWFLLTLLAATYADLKFELQSVHLSNVAANVLVPRDMVGLQKRCDGCEGCYGAGYQFCPSSTYWCFKPGDAEHGENSCPGSSTINDNTNDLNNETASDTTNDADDEASNGSNNIGGTLPTFEFCSKGGCESCFGSGYQQCPGSTITCYKPGDSRYGLDTCSSSESDTDTSTPSSSIDASTTLTSSDSRTPSAVSDSPASASASNNTTTDSCNNGGFDCTRCFDGTYIPCPVSSQYESTKYCYDPNNSTSVCPDGSSPAVAPVDSDNKSVTSTTPTGYTASTPSGPSSPGSADDSKSATGTSISGVSDNDGASSTTSTDSRTSSTPGGITASTSGTSTTSPISATTNSQLSLHGSMFELLAVTVLCFIASVGLVV